MAATTAAARLTESHRLAQARLGVHTVAAMRAIWGLLDPEDLDGSFDRWMTAAVPVVRSQRTTSARLAANYLRAFKALELGGMSAIPLVVADTISAAEVQTSLLVTGPVHVKQAMSRGVPLVQAMRTAEATSAGSAMRHALNGGRSTILDTTTADRDAIGWARATSGQPCHFCAMLASRGPAYKGEDTADFQAHDHCSCTTEPVYRRDAAWPAGSERYRDLWRQADGDQIEFRRLIEAREP